MTSANKIGFGDRYIMYSKIVKTPSAFPIERENDISRMAAHHAFEYEYVTETLQDFYFD